MMAEATVKKLKKVRLKAPKKEVKKEPEKPVVSLPEAETLAKKTERYVEAVGRRKTAIARVRLFTRSGEFTVNGRPYGAYFPTIGLQKTAEEALKKMKLWERFRVSIRAGGGGLHAQAEAIRMGLARCLVKFNPDFRKRLKKAGFLTRDQRMKERKKFGLKKARRAPQWQKR
jgi:small subunit ribosomal protein S9